MYNPVPIWSVAMCDSCVGVEERRRGREGGRERERMGEREREREGEGEGGEGGIE